MNTQQRSRHSEFGIASSTELSHGQIRRIGNPIIAPRSPSLDMPLVAGGLNRIGGMAGTEVRFR